MQYPVPQFTDVEDRIIGSLTLIQFGILFGTGIVIFLVYTGTKNIALSVIFLLLLGIPALGVAFVKVNGRPLYRSIKFFIRFVLSDKFLIFHKEVYGFGDEVKLKNVDLKVQESQVPRAPKATTESRLKEINRILEEQARAEEELIKQQRT